MKILFKVVIAIVVINIAFNVLVNLGIIELDTETD